MSAIAIQKSHEANDAPYFAELRSLFDRVKERAYNLFEGRGKAHGFDLDDWLAAEHELVWAPAFEMKETDTRFEARVAVPGFEATDIQVTASPDSIVVKAESSHTEEKKEGGAEVEEFTERTLFRRIELSAPIDVDQVKADLDNGVLVMSAGKVAAKPTAPVLAAAA